MYGSSYPMYYNWPYDKHLDVMFLVAMIRADNGQKSLMAGIDNNSKNMR